MRPRRDGPHLRIRPSGAFLWCDDVPSDAEPPDPAEAEPSSRAPEGRVRRAARWLFERGGMSVVVLVGLLVLGLVGAALPGR